MNLTYSRLTGRPWLASAVLAATLLSPGVPLAYSQTDAPASVSPDNSGTNKAHNNTADQQSEASSDCRQIIVDLWAQREDHHERRICDAERSCSFRGGEAEYCLQSGIYRR
jgi:hypothetical protein